MLKNVLIRSKSPVQNTTMEDWRFYYEFCIVLIILLICTFSIALLYSYPTSLYPYFCRGPLTLISGIMIIPITITYWFLLYLTMYFLMKCRSSMEPHPQTQYQLQWSQQYQQQVPSIAYYSQPAQPRYKRIYEVKKFKCSICHQIFSVEVQIQSRTILCPYCEYPLIIKSWDGI